jgi:LPS-assembly protein
MPAGALVLAGPVVPCALAAEPVPPLPVTLEAQTLRSTPDRETVAEGEVELRQGDLRIRADRLIYDPPSEHARASGQVVVETPSAVYRGQTLELSVRDYSGWFVAPEFDFPLLGTRGQAERVDFAGRTRLAATQAEYTSCPRVSEGEPDWLLKARRVTLDFDANEGIAEGGRLRFKGVTLLALPRLSFPVTGDRKSGWLPPTVNLDSRSGFELSVPYYWNIAPNRDATLAPRVLTRRGVGLDAEFRYLEPDFSGRTMVNGLPDDRVAGRSRYAWGWQHAQQFGRATTLGIDAWRVSDDDWWKDFPRVTPALTPRLLSSQVRLDHPFSVHGLDARAYAQSQDWQVLQTPDALIVAPYARRAQLGLAGNGPAGPLELSLETEVNRFVRPPNDAPGDRLEGWRWHALGSIAWPWRPPGGWVVPRLGFNAARYRTDTPMIDGRTDAGRFIPTLSVDAGLELERETAAYFGRTLRQTLEPRLLYVRTPYRRQDTLPSFDAFGRDFDFSSIYAPNAFAGVDRVSDANQLTAGVTSRLVDAASGAELARLGVVQRFLFSDQRVAPASDGSVDGPPLEQRFSDVLLLGSTTVLPGWALDASLQYSPDDGHVSRTVLGAAYSPGPFRTVSARYRLAREISEQVELGWQWPLYQGSRRSSGAACGGDWYSVGRVNFSLRDSRVTDSILGFEYDAGCWIARVVGERLSTGRSEATTRLLLQLELVGLSRLGSNPLRVLKDNIPGYRLLREERSSDPPALPDPSHD